MSAPIDSPRDPRARLARCGAIAIVLALIAALGACGASDDDGGKGKGKAAKAKPEPRPVPAAERRLPGFPASPGARDRDEVRESQELARDARAAAKREQPNFVQIWTDDQSIDSMKHMPRLKRLLRRQGTTFSQYHDVQPLCCPSRASYLTGQYPHNHDVLSNKPPSGGFGKLDFSETFYTALDDAGYRTGWIGKVLNVAPGTNLAVKPEPGFDDWFVELTQPKEQMRSYKLSDNGRVVDIRNGRFQNEVFANRAHRFLAAGGDRPFMLTVSMFTPHWTPCQGERGKRRECPPVPAQQDRNKFKQARFPGGPNYMPEEPGFMDRYWRREVQSLQSVDRLVAAVVKQLRREGELDNTYIIFQTDNGLLHGEHGLFGKNYPWDRSVRVPLVVRGPGFPAGANRSDLTANVDVPATILDAARVQSPLRMDGYSLLGKRQRKSLLLERLEGANKPGKEAWRQIKTADGYTYWEYEGGHRRLYDLRRDPYQLNNLARKKPELVDRLQRQIERVKDCSGDCP